MECETERSLLPQAVVAADPLLGMDPYYIHYQLSVQSIKIEEDEEDSMGLLEIDMKPHYQQLLGQKLPLSRWPQWIRDKLLALAQEGS